MRRRGPHHQCLEEITVARRRGPRPPGRAAEHVGEVAVDSPARSDSRGRRVVVDQLPESASALRYSASASAGLPVSDSRLPRLVAVRQAAAEFGDGGVVVGQLLAERQRLAVLGLRLRRLARARQQDAEVVVAVPPGCTRKLVTAGLSSASFCWIAIAWRYSASASAGWPVSDSRYAEVAWLSARSLRNSVTAGLSSASFWQIASASRYSASASAGLPVSRQQEAEVVVAVRQVAAESRDGGVVVGQLLADRHRRAVLGLRLRRLARLRQQDAEARCG